MTAIEGTAVGAGTVLLIVLLFGGYVWVKHILNGWWH